MPETEIQKDAEPTSKTQTQKQLTNKKILSFSLEFGFMIAIPLVVLALTGKWLAAKHHNEGFLYGGIVLALIISVAWFFKRIKDIYNDFLN